MISVLFAFLISTAQDQAATQPVDQNQVSETKTPEAEKICKRKFRSTGEGITGLKAVKVCKTKEEWDRYKAPGTR